MDPPATLIAATPLDETGLLDFVRTRITRAPDRSQFWASPAGGWISPKANVRSAVGI